MDWFWFSQGSIEILVPCKVNMCRLLLNRRMPNPTGNVVSQLKDTEPAWRFHSINNHKLTVSLQSDYVNNVYIIFIICPYLFIRAGFHEFAVETLNNNMISTWQQERHLFVSYRKSWWSLRPQLLRRESGDHVGKRASNHWIIYRVIESSLVNVVWKIECIHDV